MDIESPVLSWFARLEVLDGGPADLNLPESGLQHEIAHGFVPALLERALSEIGGELGQKPFGIVDRQWPSLRRPIGCPAFNELGGIHRSSVEGFEGEAELPEGDEIAIHGAGRSKCPFEMGPIGIHQLDRPGDGRLRGQRLEPLEEKEEPFLVGADGAGQDLSVCGELLAKPGDLEFDADEPPVVDLGDGMGGLVRCRRQTTRRADRECGRRHLVPLPNTMTRFLQHPSKGLPSPVSDINPFYADPRDRSRWLRGL